MLYIAMLANLSRQTLSNWIMSSAAELQIVYNIMKEELLNRNYIQADETTLQVIDESDKNSKSKKYMWLYCLAHIRRKYHEIIVDLDKEALKKSRAIIRFNYCEKLYTIEKDLRESYSKDDDYYEKRYKIRLEKSASLLDEFQEYVEREIKDALPKSPLGKALDYTIKLMPDMKTLLENGSLEIDNNGAERAIKPFVIGRKNWLFSNTAKGANSSALLYSIIETAKANGLVVEKYLMYLFDMLANAEVK